MAFSRTPSEGRDLLRTTTINETIRGLGGSDRISSIHSGSKLYGGEGKDWLISDLFAETLEGETPQTLTTEQDGGTGNDRMSASAFGQSELYAAGPIFKFDLAGGAGEDEIWLEIKSAEGEATINGGLDNDTISSTIQAGLAEGGIASNAIEGDGGDDKIFAFASSDFLGTSENTVWGNDGDDDIDSIIDTDNGTGVNKVYGGDGADHLSLDGNGIADNLAWGGEGGDIIIATGVGVADVPTIENKVYGNNGADIITLVADIAEGIISTYSYNYGYGGNGDDVLTATAPVASDSDISQSKLYGGSGADSLRVYGGSENTLDGGAGNDTLTGGGADDILIGGSGADQLKGGRGDDTFRYLWMTGTKETTRDSILDFGFGSKSRGDDVIDLSKIDANTGKSGDQAFKFGGTTKTGTGYVWIEEDDGGSGSLVKARNGGSETLVIAVDDGAGTSPSDWSASDFLL